MISENSVGNEIFFIFSHFMGKLFDKAMEVKDGFEMLEVGI